MHSDRLLWIVIAALGLTVVALALRHQQGTIAGYEWRDIETVEVT